MVSDDDKDFVGRRQNSPYQGLACLWLTNRYWISVAVAVKVLVNKKVVESSIEALPPISLDCIVVDKCIPLRLVDGDRSSIWLRHDFEIVD
jgi:hypothetical protein